LRVWRRVLSVRTLLKAIVLLAPAICLVLLISGCTFARYEDPDGRSLLIADLRLAGSDIAVSVTRPDGTRIDIMRQQQTPEDTIEAIGKAANPLPRINP